MIKHLFKKIFLAKTPKQKARKQFNSIKLGKDDVAIDCGANVGKFTKQLSRSGATVYAFEPNPFAFEVLQDRYSKKKNIHCIPKGVSIEKGRMKLYSHKNSDLDEVNRSTSSSLLALKSNVSSAKYTEVEIVDLCEFIESLNHRVRVLKMDIEGAESPILMKLINTGLIDIIDYVFVETHDHKIPEIKEETDAIRRLIVEREIENINLNWR